MDDKTTEAPDTEQSRLKVLIDTLPQVGAVTWIGLRPARREPVQSVSEVQAVAGRGLEGDRYAGRTNGKRQVTLIQAEHLSAVGSFLGCGAIDPALPRRNIVVAGINLLALKDKRFRVGGALFECTGLCHPCSQMEEAFGKGGYNAMRGHGGVTARVLEDGLIRTGDRVSVEQLTD